MRKGMLWALLTALLVGLAAPWAMADPPPWAPAHGRRRKVKEVVYVASPFVYSGVTYVPLRNVTSLVGAALLWDGLRGRAAVTYNGRELGLVIGSPRVYYGDEVMVMRAAPIVVHDVVYVPAEFCDRYLEVPTRHRRGVVEFEGPEGWRTYQVAPRPPGRVIVVREARPRVYRVSEKGWGKTKIKAQKVKVREIRPGRGGGEWKAKGGKWKDEGGRGRGKGGGQGRGRGHGGRD